MKRCTNILFYTSGEAGSRFSLKRAVDLAERNARRLTVVTVVREMPRDLSRLAAALPSERIQSMATQEARERWDRFVAPLPRTNRAHAPGPRRLGARPHLPRPASDD